MIRGVIALLCAVPAEERMLRGLAGPDVRVVVTGMGAVPAERHAAAAIADGAVATISVGFCGGLDPTLGLGDVVIPERVINAITGETFACDAALDGLAVDMESAGAARACAAAGVPFAAIRAVTDRAGDVLPRLDGLVDDAGRVHRGRMARRLVTHPDEIAAWARLARGASAARRGLVPAITAALAGTA